MKASRIPGEGTPHERKRDLKQRVFDEVIKFLGIAFYLWVMFGVFALHEFSGVGERSYKLSLLRLRSRECACSGESGAYR